MLQDTNKIEGGPFQEAKDNISVFVENYMILWTTYTSMQALDLGNLDDQPNTLVVEIAEATLRELFNYVLVKSGGIWN